MDYALSHSRPNNAYYFQYNKGSFDTESWACGVKNLPGFDKDGMVHKTCSLETGARFLTIFTLLFSTALFIVMWLDWRGPKYLMQTWKNRRASWRNDYVWRIIFGMISGCDEGNSSAKLAAISLPWLYAKQRQDFARKLTIALFLIMNYSCSLFPFK